MQADRPTVSPIELKGAEVADVETVHVRRVGRRPSRMRHSRSSVVGVLLASLAVATLMVIAAWMYVLIPAPTVLGPRGPAELACVDCPSGETGCEPECHGGCTPCPSGETGCSPDCSKPCVAPSISSYSNPAPVANGYRQAEVFWNYSGSANLVPSFTWNPSGGSELAGPEIDTSGDSASVNLNELSPSTTYDYEVSVENGCGSASDTGSFTTSSAPSNQVTGWVYSQSLAPTELEPEGTLLSGVSLYVTAYCTYLGYATDQVVFSIGTTSSSGYFASPSFPIASGASGGPYSLSSSGVCSTSAGSYPSVSNSHYVLAAEAPSYYWAQRWVPFPISSTSSPQSFALLANFGSEVPLSEVLVHTTYNGVTYNNAACSSTFETSSTTAQVSQTVGLNGQTGIAEASSISSSWNVAGAAGASIGLSLMYPFTGYVNDSALTASNLMDDSWVEGQEYGSVTGPYQPTDWMTAPTYSPTAIPSSSGWQMESAASGNPATYTLFQSGTYSSTTGLDASLGLSVGWGGQSVGVSVPIQATSTVTTTISNTVSCTFTYAADPSGNGGQPYFWLYFGSPASAIDHVWLVGWCNGNNEPSC
jgi:hypothetical protein